MKRHDADLDQADQHTLGVKPEWCREFNIKADAWPRKRGIEPGYEGFRYGTIDQGSNRTRRKPTMIEKNQTR